jgi:poly(3-hydroxybutyrate) depolymerase
MRGTRSLRPTQPARTVGLAERSVVRTLLAALAVVALGASLLVGPLLAGPVAAATPAGPVIATATLTFDGFTRAYETVVPATGSRGLPLIMFLPGTDASPAQELQRDDLLQFVAKGQVSLVYPTGLAHQWNVGDNCCLRGNTTPTDDIGYIRALTKAVAASLHPNGHRIYLMGYSAGAKLAWQLVCQATGPFAALATYGGNPETSCSTRRSAIPVLAGYGADDTDEPLLGKPTNRLGTHPPAMDTVATWITRDGCSIHRRHTADVNKQVTVVGYTPCSRTHGGVEFAVWQTGTHMLPQLPLVPFGDLAWTFLQNQSRS